jgi:hypothetical protein
LNFRSSARAVDAQPNTATATAEPLHVENRMTASVNKEARKRIHIVPWLATVEVAGLG